MSLKTLNQVAKQVCRRWDNLVGGEYIAPPCPPERILSTLLSTVNYAAGFPEEGRYPRFNISVAEVGSTITDVCRFLEPRPATIPEFRRLIPATDSRKSAIHVEWSAHGDLRIAGILDLGTTWHRARIGLGYKYNSPSTMFVEIERPNVISIYQGQYRISRFTDGNIDQSRLEVPQQVLHESATQALEEISDQLVRPEYESPREFLDFEYIAMMNCYAAIANTIAMANHGGAVLILPASQDARTNQLRIKYPMAETSLTAAFVKFMNTRHKYWDLMERMGDNENPEDSGVIREVDWQLSTDFDELTEKLRLVAKFAECDGALVISRSLEVLGFGCEIAVELRNDTTVIEKTEWFGGKGKNLSLEQFGMRHRSAIKFVSHNSSAVSLVISQDGPISGVWSERGSVNVRKDIRLVNQNLPWA